MIFENSSLIVRFGNDNLKLKVQRLEKQIPKNFPDKINMVDFYNTEIWLINKQLNFKIINIKMLKLINKYIIFDKNFNKIKVIYFE